MGSQGIAETTDTKVFEELLSRHPFHPPPSVFIDPKPALVVDESAVLSCLKTFPKGTSPGYGLSIFRCNCWNNGSFFSRLLGSFNRIYNFLLSDKAPSCLAPWLCGAALSALLKEGGGVRPIAVGEIFCWLAIHHCYFVVQSRLPEVFLPFGQVSVGISGGLEAAVHSARLFVAHHCDDPDLALL